MSRIVTAAALAALLVAAWPLTAHAIDDVHCDSGEVGLVKTYVSQDGAFGDTRANDNGKIRLRGWVYIPNSTPPANGFPAIVWNHGSEDTPAAKCVLTDYFVQKKKFVLFVPIRRGHEGSTGEYFDDYATRKAWDECQAVGTPSFCNDEDDPLFRAFKRIHTVDYLREQGREDVNDAVKYIKTFPKVNSSRIAVIGHSFGGIVSLFFNTLDGDDTKAVVDISGGAQSWGDNDPADYLQSQMKDAVDNATRPIFFMQPMNDVNRLPTMELSYRAGLRNMRWQAAIFPKVPDELLVCADTGNPCPCDDPDVPGPDLGTSCEDVAHGKFVTDETQITKWAPTVVDFLRRMGVK